MNIPRVKEAIHYITYIETIRPYIFSINNRVKKKNINKTNFTWVY